MGIVYKAQDTKLNRLVALKFLPINAFLGDEEKIRFHREAQTAAALTHSNICTVYEIDEVDGKSFIAMAYLEGQTLKQKLSAAPLSLEVAINLTIQIAEGLQAAHEREIVHRDIKSSNILITDKGQVKIMDFGLAKRGEATQLTKTGVTLGTVPYMSPEQARGDKVDPRTDIWSLGVVLYEMLSGRLPFIGEFNEAIVYSILQTAPQPVTGLRSGVPIAIDAIITKCLEKRPEDRYQHADELIVDLHRLEKEANASKNSPHLSGRFKSGGKKSRWLISGGVIVGIAAIFAVYFFLRPTSESNEKIPIAVADFENGTKENELDGLSGMLITSLEQSRRLDVLTRSRMFDILKQIGKVDVTRIDEALGKEICARANVNALVLASVQKLGKTYVIDLKVVDPAADSYIITAKAEAHSQDEIPAILDDLSEITRKGMNEKLAEINLANKKIADITTTSLEAYQHFFNGEDLMDKIHIKEAADEYKKAIAVDTAFGLAWYRLAYASTWDRDQAPEDQIRKAYAFVDHIPQKEQYLLRALNASIENGKDQAVSILQQMEKVYPNDKEMLYLIGDWSHSLRRDSVAIHNLERIVAKDSMHTRALQDLTSVNEEMGKYDTMLKYAKLYAAAATSDEARTGTKPDLVRGGAVAPGTDEAYGKIGLAYRMLGDFENGIKFLVHARERSPSHRYEITAAIVESYIDQGQNQKAVNEIQKFTEGDQSGATIEGRKNILRRAALQYEQVGRMKEAREYNSKVLSLSPNRKDFYSLVRLGWISTREKKFADAERYFSESIPLSPNTHGARAGLIQVFLARKEFHRADSLLEEGLQNLPRPDLKVAFLMDVGWAYSAYGLPEKAEELFKKALSYGVATTEGIIPFGHLAGFYLQRARYAEAEDYFQRALKNNPRDAGALSGLGAVKIARKEWNPAEEFFKQYVKALPTKAGTKFGEVMQGHIALLRGNLRDAELHFRKSISADSLWDVGYSSLAWLYMGLRRYQDAIPLAEKGFRMDSNYESCSILSAALILGDRAIDRGIALANAGVSLKPPFYMSDLKIFKYPMPPEITLGAAYKKKKDQVQALKFFDLAEKLYSGIIEMNLAIDSLRQPL